MGGALSCLGGSGFDLVVVLQAGFGGALLGVCGGIWEIEGRPVRPRGGAAGRFGGGLLFLGRGPFEEGNSNRRGAAGSTWLWCEAGLGVCGGSGRCWRLLWRARRRPIPPSPRLGRPTLSTHRPTTPCFGSGWRRGGTLRWGPFGGCKGEIEESMDVSGQEHSSPPRNSQNPQSQSQSQPNPPVHPTQPRPPKAKVQENASPLPRTSKNLPQSPHAPPQRPRSRRTCSVR